MMRWRVKRRFAVFAQRGFSKAQLPIGLMVAGPQFSEGRLRALARRKT